MTELRRRKFALCGLVFSFVLVVLVATTVAPTAQAGPRAADDGLIVGLSQTAVGELPFNAQNTTSQNAIEGNIRPMPDLLAALALIGTDTTPPTATAPIQKIAKGEVSSTVPINVRWSASDASGVIAYRLWRSTDGGAFVRDKTLPPTATSHNYQLTVGHSYRFLVRAYDGAGNASAPARGPTFTPNVTDDRSCCFYFARGASWRQEVKTGAYNGSVTTLYAGGTGAGGWVRFTFTGRDVAHVAYVAGGPQIVNRWHWATLDTRTIKVSGTGVGFNVDAFVVNE